MVSRDFWKYHGNLSTGIDNKTSVKSYFSSHTIMSTCCQSGRASPESRANTPENLQQKEQRENKEKNLVKILWKLGRWMLMWQISPSFQKSIFHNSKRDTCVWVQKVPRAMQIRPRKRICKKKQKKVFKNQYFTI
jgi:hypothetical protein